MERMVEKLTDDKWEPIEFMFLRPGDTFRFLDDGTVVMNQQGHSVYIAASQPKKNQQGVPTITILSA